MDKDDGEWKIDEGALESQFTLRKLKVYVEGLQLERYRRIQQLCTLLWEFGVPWNQINGMPALAKIIEANGRAFTPKWQAFTDL